MKKILLAISGILSLESLLGCAPETFPQYSATYQLQSLQYTDSAFAGEKRMPNLLKIVDRMDHLGGYWNHLLRFEFQSFSPDETGGNLLFNLDDLLRDEESTFPHKKFKGVNIFSEDKVGSSAFCYYQYHYYLFMEANPSAEILQLVYPGQGEYIGDDPVTGMPLHLSLSNPEKVELDENAVEEWYGQIDDNEGIALRLILTRHIASEGPGGDDYKDCILLSDPRHKESMIAVYKFHYDGKVEWEEQEHDIRKGDVYGLEQGTIPPISFFKQVISDIKF